MDIDKDAVKQELQDIIDTAKAVRGEEFASMIGFVGNCTSLTKIFGMAILSNDNLDEDMKDMLGMLVCATVSDLCDSYGEALGLPDADRKEAVTMVEVIENKLKQRITEAKRCG